MENQPISHSDFIEKVMGPDRNMIETTVPGFYGWLSEVYFDKMDAEGDEQLEQQHLAFASTILEKWGQYNEDETQEATNEVIMTGIVYNILFSVSETTQTKSE